MILLDLFWSFLQVGCFSFGGGYGAVALIRQTVLSHGWMTEELLADVIAVSESTPGPIMVNLATYVGSARAGVLGAAVATLAVVLPAFCVILVLMAVMKRFLTQPHVRAAMDGFKASVTGIILATGLTMSAARLFPGGGPDWIALGLFALLAGVYFGAKPLTGRKLSPLGLIGLSALLGALVYSL